LFEDVDFLRRARRISHIYSFPAAVVTSARRYRNSGIVRQQFRNLWLMLQYLAGAPPEVLAKAYREMGLTNSSPSSSR